ncbi:MULTISPECIES: hypothetical protein [Microcystis]|uniref:Uncharacterized protein n=1 Tax=Microcystis panniformis FACHB-1757 TaxID=1638788 RepID=A0A0K1RTZ1_9CHRO|nr:MULTISPECIES: hypothetical protein [Microcystis]AKV65367.1 hypothetical protein VL20_126 [Microcystis panniformis FACHB-1757]
MNYEVGKWGSGEMGEFQLKPQHPPQRVGLIHSPNLILFLLPLIAYEVSID